MCSCCLHILSTYFFIFQYKHKLIFTSIRSIHPSIIDLQLSMVSHIIPNFLSLKRFRQDAKTNNISLLIQIYFNLIPMLIPHKIPTFHTYMSIPMILNSYMYFTTNRTTIIFIHVYIIFFLSHFL